MNRIIIYDQDYKTTNIPLPFSAKLPYVFLLLGLLCAMEVYINGILFLAYFALHTALVHHPLVAKLKKRRVPEVVSTLIAFLLAYIIIFGIIFLLVTEESSFLKDFHKLQKNFEVY